MIKKLLFSFLAFSLVLPSLVVGPVKAEGEVCGVDNATYESAKAAETAGVDISYEFTCVDPQSEEGLYEEESEVNFAGMLIEVGSTDVPTNLIIRKNGTDEDYTVAISENTVLGQRSDQKTQLSDWIPGDQIKVIGVKNENTGNVEATLANNKSIKILTNLGANGWITDIDKETKTITYQWANENHTIVYDDDTRFVSGLKNPASVDDLVINDRIRGRLLKRADGDPLAKIVIVLRRGSDLFMKIRTFTPNATLVSMDSAIIPTTIQVRIDATKGLRKGDVNNLVGTEGDLVTVNVTEDTNLVRKYFGKTTLNEFAIGDRLQIVGRANDDSTIDAKLIKNLKIWKTSTRGHAGVVTEVNSGENYLMVNWTPIKYPTRKKLKEKLDEQPVQAQTVNTGDTPRPMLMRANKKNAKEKIKDRFRQGVQKVKEKVGKLKRKIKLKKVKIDRIQHAGVKLKDLIERRPVKKVKVTVDEDTEIVVGTNTGATLADIKNGDKVRIRGVRQSSEQIVIAETIVVVSSLPEIDEPLETDLDEVNEYVEEIDTDDDENELVSDTSSDTEEEVDLEDDSSDDSSSDDSSSDDSSSDDSSSDDSVQ